MGFIGTQFRSHDGQVAVYGTFGTDKFADAIDGVVVIEEQQELTTGSKGIGLTEQPERVAGIGCEDNCVFVGGSAKKLEHKSTRLFDQCGRGSRGWIEGVWVAKDVVAQQFHMFTELALGVKATTGIVEVDMPMLVQATVFCGAQFVE